MPQIHLADLSSLAPSERQPGGRPGQISGSANGFLSRPTPRSGRNRRYHRLDNWFGRVLPLRLPSALRTSISPRKSSRRAESPRPVAPMVGVGSALKIARNASADRRTVSLSICHHFAGAHHRRRWLTEITAPMSSDALLDLPGRKLAKTFLVHRSPKNQHSMPGDEKCRRASRGEQMRPG